MRPYMARRLFSGRSFPMLDVPHPANNVPPSIRALLRAPTLLQTPGHPLANLKSIIVDHFTSQAPTTHPVPFQAFEG